MGNAKPTPLRSHRDVTRFYIGASVRFVGMEEMEIAYLSRPSKLAHEVVRASYGTPILKTMVSGRMMGRNDSVCAQTAVTKMTGFSG